MKTITEMLKTMSTEEVIAQKPVLTVAELEADLKYHGVRTSPMKIRAMIRHGQYPFAVGYQEKTTQCEIYTKPYIEFLDKMFGLPQRETA
jgi:hypothetical protein